MAASRGSRSGPPRLAAEAGAPGSIRCDAEPRAARRTAEIASRRRRKTALPRLAKFLAGRAPVRGFPRRRLRPVAVLRDIGARRPEILDALFDADGRRAAGGDRAPRSPGDRAPTTLAKPSLMTALRQLEGGGAFPHRAGRSRRRGRDVDDGAAAERSRRCLHSSAAVDFLLRDAHGQGKLRLPDPDDPARQSGWILLGMGKLGAHELNYLLRHRSRRLLRSGSAGDRRSARADRAVSSRLTRRLVRILQDRTEHGYVFRTDLGCGPIPARRRWRSRSRPRCATTRASARTGSAPR